MFCKASIVLALAASATAHMRLRFPVPYGFDSLTSSPLELSDYPCKQRAGVYDVTEMNHWNAGETKEVSFFGSAVHGGGSCQFSLTSDPSPSKSTQWKVIHSVVGGCPSNVTGNLAENASGTQAAVFPVQMPSDLPEGQYTFAWSWLNKIGNREFYMNCAPIQVGSASGPAYGADAALSSLPDMFVANLPATSCSTTAEQDFSYPNPGKSMIEGNGAALGNDLTGAGCAEMTKMGAGNGQMGTPTQPDTLPKSSAGYQQPAPAKSSAAYGQPAPAKPSSGYGQPAPAKPSSGYGQPAVPSNPGGAFAPGASKAPVAQPTPSSASESDEATAPDAAGTDAPSSEGECTACSEDGALVCIGAKQYAICNRGCAVAQDLAEGTSCSNGSIVGATKRSFTFPRAHLHRRHGSAHVH